MPFGWRSKKNYSRSNVTRYTTGAARKRMAATKIQRAWRKKKISAKRSHAMVIAGVETKLSMMTIPDNQNIGHNNFITLESSLLSMRFGNDMNSSTLKSAGIVSSSRYYAKGVSFRFMLENPADRPYVIYRFMIVRAAHGQNPDRTNLFEGVSGNKMIDYIDKDRFTVCFQKWIHVKAPNTGTMAGANANGTYNAVDIEGDETVHTSPKKVVKLYWPCKKHIRLHDIQERETIDGIPDMRRSKDFNYHVLLYAYDNYITPQDLTTVGRVNDYVSKVYVKDY